MPVSGLVVTLTTDAALAAGAIASLRALPGVEVGEPRGCKLPLVTEAQSAGAAHDLHDAIRAVPGVVGADVTFVGYQDDVGPAALDRASARHQPSQSGRAQSRAVEVSP